MPRFGLEIVRSPGPADSDPFDLQADIDRAENARAIFRQFAADLTRPSTMTRPDRMTANYARHAQVEIGPAWLRLTSTRPFYPEPREAWVTELRAAIAAFIAAGDRG